MCATCQGRGRVRWERGCAHFEQSGGQGGHTTHRQGLGDGVEKPGVHSVAKVATKAIARDGGDEEADHFDGEGCDRDGHEPAHLALDFPDDLEVEPLEHREADDLKAEEEERHAEDPKHRADHDVLDEAEAREEA